MGYVMLVSGRVTVFFQGLFLTPNLTESAEPNQETWERSPKIKNAEDSLTRNETEKVVWKRYMFLELGASSEARTKNNQPATPSQPLIPSSNSCIYI